MAHEITGGLRAWAAVDWWGGLRTGADILIVAYLIYRLMMLAKGTRAWQIISGLFVFVLILILSSWAQLHALNWILRQMFQLGPVAIVVLFYPELRHAMEEVGRLGFWGRGFTALGREDLTTLANEIVRAAGTLSDRKIGALIVLERETGLTDVIETGTLVNAVVSAELLETIFYPGSPLHDGAAIVRLGRVVAAGCTLPLTDNPIGLPVHTRHKAALGMSERSDALILVVSEETGIISLAFDGKMERGVRDERLRDRLIQTFTGRERPTRRPLLRRAPRAPNAPPPRPDPPAGHPLRAEGIAEGPAGDVA
ncbi:MAG: TIGR00159 family protein [Armatimonadetes bacterium]|nr:TIGR00159 family protein [Armatimonadota bacterium]